MKLVREAGGVALEYVLVTTFAMVMSLAMLAIVTSVIESKLEVVAERLGIEWEEISLNPFRLD